MDIITWKDKYSVKIDSIDNQHKQIISLINKLHNAMTHGRGRDILDQIFLELIEYTVSHFSFEENMMKINNYSEISSHKEIHENLTKKVRNLQKDFKDGNTQISVEVMMFLKEWLKKHIMEIDHKYIPYIKKSK